MRTRWLKRFVYFFTTCCMGAQDATSVTCTQELDFLEPDAVVYKQVGPVLVKQELEEANVNVSKRIEYLTAEMKRIEDTLTDLNKKKEVKTKKIMEMQQAMQAAAQAAAKK
eukprot:c8075_g1_i1.p1 GENE.c8075_g1_i1~~c8075_g1_i1.p1  ORF type:complete len:111 (-),score=27.77 c8075_g1_i1:230-562(-)